MGWGLIFSIIWTAMTLIVGFVLALVTNFNGEVDAGTIPCLVIVAMFLFIGVVMIYLELKHYLTDRRTERFGEICYGRIKRIYACNASSGGHSELKAEVKVYIPSYDIVVDAEESVGYNTPDYEIGDYVKVKYYIGDINFISKIESTLDLPARARHLLEDKVRYSEDNGSLDLSEVDTKNWTLTEEAFASAEQFEENRTGSFVKKNPTKEEKKQYPYLYDNKWKKEISLLGVAAAVGFIIVFAFLVILSKF